MLQTIPIPRTMGGTLIIQVDVVIATSTLSPATTLVTFHDGKTEATFRDGKSEATYRDGATKIGGR